MIRCFCFFRVLNFLEKLIKGVICVLSLELLFFTFFFFKEQKREGSLLQSGFLENKQFVKDKMFVFSGLHLKKESETFYQQDLEDNFFVLSNNSRPDAGSEDNLILVGLKNSNETQSVALSEKTYLIYKEGFLHFSHDPTSLWIKVKEIKDRKSKLEGALFLSNEDKEIVYQEKFFIEKAIASCSSFEELFLQDKCFSLFDQATVWPPDLLYETYGGDDYEKMKNSYRLKFSTSNGEVFFLKKGSMLVFSEGKWVEVQKDQEVKNHPLGLIDEISPHKIQLRLWDSTGLYSKELSLKVERMPSLNIRAEEVFLKPRQRASQIVSCKIGKQNCLLKKGDWLLKTQTHWKVLRTWDEIEKSLNFDLKGELFVFEGIEKSEGNPVFKGILFDTMRTQAQQVNIPLNSFEKKGSRKKNQGLNKKESESFSMNEKEKDELLKLTQSQKHYEFSK